MFDMVNIVIVSLLHKAQNKERLMDIFFNPTLEDEDEDGAW